MYIYLKNNKDLKENISTENEKRTPCLLGIAISQAESVPYLAISAGTFDKEFVTSNELLKRLFVKATDYFYPNYSQHRMEGIYVYGHARGELYRQLNGDLKLEIETTSLDSIEDMKCLKEKIAAGDIVPLISYEKEQKKNHLLNTLKGLISQRKLTYIQRFFIALRLTVSTK